MCHSPGASGLWNHTGSSVPRGHGLILITSCVSVRGGAGLWNPACPCSWAHSRFQDFSNPSLLPELRLGSGKGDTHSPPQACAGWAPESSRSLLFACFPIFCTLGSSLTLVLALPPDPSCRDCARQAKASKRHLVFLIHPYVPSTKKAESLPVRNSEHGREGKHVNRLARVEGQRSLG